MCGLRLFKEFHPSLRIFSVKRTLYKVSSTPLKPWFLSDLLKPESKSIKNTTSRMEYSMAMASLSG